MSDPNFWKEHYKGKWQASKTKEENISKLISELTGKTLIPKGLGAGSAQYFAGTAASQGHEKGEADYKVKDTNIHLEITGPLKHSVGIEAALWVRPDKIDYAKKHKELETWVIHHLAKDGTLRVIPLDDSFFTRYDRKEFPTIHPRIDGATETYIEIPASDKAVKSFQELIDRLQKI